MARIQDSNTAQMIQLQVQATHSQDHINPIKIQEPNNQIKGWTAGHFFRKLFRNLFYFHIFLIAILTIFLTTRGLVSAARHHHFHPKNWYPPLITATASSGIVAFVWQSITHRNPAKAIRAAFWLSPLLTCAVGILFLIIGSPRGLAAAVLALVFALIQSLYSCWVNPRFDHATRILSVSTTYPPGKTTLLVILSITVSTLYLCFLVSGIGGATSTATGNSLDNIYIFVILLSLAWTMHIIKNAIQVTISRIKYTQFVSGIDMDTSFAFRCTIKYLIGGVSLGSVLVPVLGLVRGSARAINSISGDADEFMFSCANCYSGVASRLITYGNRWGFVQVGVYNKGFVPASKDTWEMFQRVGMEPLIDFDLTSSFCFLCGVAGGAVCTLVGGSWSFVIHKGYALEVSIYAFLIGYFMCRVAMAWPQACVSAYYVAYAENPQNPRFDSTIPVRIQELARSRA